MALKLKTTLNEEYGLVAILDALGAAQFGTSEITEFLKARGKVLRKLSAKADDLLSDNLSDISETRVSTFTFNDTIIVTFRCGKTPPKLAEICAFFLTIRKFVVDSLAHGILFRGAIGADRFIINEETNTVMGSAVSDAAAWYEEAQWIGVHCTPRCSLFLDALLLKAEKEKIQIMLDYEVPLKEGKKRRLKCINWPRVFLLPRINPWGSEDAPEAKLRELLAKHKIPLGTESKYEATISFFDHCMKEMKAIKSSSST